MNKNLAFQRASSSFLTEGVPYGFLDLTEENQDQFICDHLLEPFENFEPRDVFGYIQSAARSFEGLDIPEKNYIVGINTIEGERESFDKVLINATNPEEANYLALLSLAHNNIDGDAARIDNNGSLWDCGDEIYRKPYSIEALTDEEFKVLKRYL
jgi:hypothetical protein